MFSLTTFTHYTLPIAVVIINTSFLFDPNQRDYLLRINREKLINILYIEMQNLMDYCRKQEMKETNSSIRLIKKHTYTLQTQTDLRDSLSELIALGTQTE